MLMRTLREEVVGKKKEWLEGLKRGKGSGVEG